MLLTICLERMSSACVFITCVKWVAIMEGGSITVYPALSAAAWFDSEIQIAGRPKAGSKVGSPGISS